MKGEEGEGGGGGAEYEEAEAMNEVDAGRNFATPASVRHDDDEPLTLCVFITLTLIQEEPPCPQPRPPKPKNPVGRSKACHPGALGFDGRS